MREWNEGWKGCSRQGYSSCKGPEVGKAQRMQGTQRELERPHTLRGSMQPPGAGKVGRGQTLQGLGEHRQASESHGQ